MNLGESFCLSCRGVICSHGSAEPAERKIERASASFMATCPVSASSDRERFIDTSVCRSPRYGAVCPGTSRAPAHDWGPVLTYRVIYHEREMMKECQARLWWSCSTRFSPSLHACTRRLVMAGFSLSCSDLILMCRMRLPPPTSNLSGSGKKPPNKNPKLICVSKTVTYKIRSKPESVGPYPNAS